MQNITWAKQPQNHGIYLDANSGAPLRLEVCKALEEYLTSNSYKRVIGNASSIHAFGRDSKKLVSDAKKKIAHSLGKSVDSEQLVLTSSGSESNQVAIKSVLEPALRSIPAPVWITSLVEHDSTVQLVKWFESLGGKVRYIPVLPTGKLEIEKIESLICQNTILISLVWVNNETGIITDILKLKNIKNSNKKIKIHIDAAQAWGKLPLDVTITPADYMSFSGHKIGALPGTGLLWMREGNHFSPLILGKQERGRRGGTENILGVYALGIAAGVIDPTKWAERVMPQRDYLEAAILGNIPGVTINGYGLDRVANTINVSFEGLGGESLVIALDLAGFSVSSGSACSSGAIEPSHVLLAMGKSKAQAMSALRISLADEMPQEQVENFVSVLKNIVERIRSRVKKTFPPISPSFISI